MPGRPINLDIRRPTVLAVDIGGVVWTFFFLSPLSFFFLLFLPLTGRWPDID